MLNLICTSIKDPQPRKSGYFVRHVFFLLDFIRELMQEWQNEACAHFSHFLVPQKK